MSYKHNWPCAIFGATLPVVAREPWCVCTIECMYHWCAISSMWHVTCLIILGCTLKNNILCVGYTCDFCLGINVSVYLLKIASRPPYYNYAKFILWSVQCFWLQKYTRHTPTNSLCTVQYSVFFVFYTIPNGPIPFCNTAKDWYQGKALV